MNSLNFPCSLCSRRFRTGAEVNKHQRIAHTAKSAAPPTRQVDQRIEGGRDHAAARPAVSDDPDGAAADAAADSGFPDNDHGSEGDTGDYDCFVDGDDQQAGEDVSYQLMSMEDFEALKKQLQEESYNLDLEVGMKPVIVSALLHIGRLSHTAAHGAHIKSACSTVVWCLYNCITTASSSPLLSPGGAVHEST